VIPKHGKSTIKEHQNLYSLLLYCTHNPVDYDRLVQIAGTITNWDALSAEAEAHHLGPLLYTNLKAANVALPRPVKRQLQGLYLRHRHANQIRTQILSEMLAAYQAAEIEALVVKGAALAHLVYLQPGLRPMRDIDLLVKPSQVHEAQQLLTELDFNVPVLPTGEMLPSKHLPVAVRHADGVIISVEIHHNLFHQDYLVSMTTDNLTSQPIGFTLPNNITAYTLGYQDMLWHLSHHISNIAYPFRLIWIKDIVGFAEKFVDQIDWEFIQHHYPRILNILSLFHWMAPLSDTLQQAASLKLAYPPKGIGQEFAGWPRYSMAQQRHKSLSRIIADTFFPSEWWLHLYYGIGQGIPLFWHRWLWHPLHIFGLVIQLLREKLA